MKRTVLSVIICVLCAAMLISSLGVSARAESIDTVAFNKITGRSWVSDRNCSHSWVRATCTTPGYCTKCQVTNEKALGHHRRQQRRRRPDLRKLQGNGNPGIQLDPSDLL